MNKMIKIIYIVGERWRFISNSVCKLSSYFWASARYEEREVATQVSEQVLLMYVSARHICVAASHSFTFYFKNDIVTTLCLCSAEVEEHMTVC